MNGRVWRGHKALARLLVPLKKLKQDPKNTRLHNERNVNAIKSSLEQYGQLRPALHRKNVIHVGNGMHLAAQELGWTHLAALDAAHLTNEQVRAYAIMDNKSAELAEWDFASLSAAFKSLPAELLEFTGFAQYEIEPLMEATWTPPNVDRDASTHTHQTVVFAATLEQAEIIKTAIEKVRHDEDADQKQITDGRALELICADFNAGS